jgi:hypothetical protein
MSSAFSLLSSLLIHVHVSASSNSIFLKYMLHIIILHFCLYLYSIINC